VTLTGARAVAPGSAGVDGPRRLWDAYPTGAWVDLSPDATAGQPPGHDTAGHLSPHGTAAHLPGHDTALPPPPHDTHPGDQASVVHRSAMRGSVGDQAPRSSAPAVSRYAGQADTAKLPESTAPTDGATWVAERTVRAEVLALLLLGTRGGEP